MTGTELGRAVGITEPLILKACNLSMKAHKSGKQRYTKDKMGTKETVFFGFAGSWSVPDWFVHGPFGEAKIDVNRFPSIKSIGVDDKALVNAAFQRTFDEILDTTPIQKEVEKAFAEKKQVIFAGHSAGGSIAILATLFFLERRRKLGSEESPPRCVTFGSPLLGDRIIPHSLERENWSQYFVHFVKRYDIVPRISLAPLSNVEKELQETLQYLNPSLKSGNASIDSATFYEKVMRSASSVTSHAASKLKGCTNLLLETLASFTELSPYRPSGTFVLCNGNGGLIVVKNSDAILQLLYYSAQLSSEAELGLIANLSLQDHLTYESELKESLNMQTVVILDIFELQGLPLSSEMSDDVNPALNDLGLSTNARLCLRAAGELQKQKEQNQVKIDNKRNEIEQNLRGIQDYQQLRQQLPQVGYYDSFKQSNDEEDFKANIKRLELAGIWDEIVEMLKRYELPEGFEGQKDWVELGTRFRRLVEPLDIANYYRHSKNEDTGSYEKRGRPKRYRFTQRWHEHANKMPVDSSSESCFWAKVEECRVKPNIVTQEVLKLEEATLKWINAGELGRDIFLQGSTFVEWWKKLPNHKTRSCLAGFINPSS